MYAYAPLLHTMGAHIVSCDEMTGIQALERIAPTLPMQPGVVERREFEYERHGTLSLSCNLCRLLSSSASSTDLMPSIKLPVGTHGGDHPKPGTRRLFQRCPPVGSPDRECIGRCLDVVVTG